MSRIREVREVGFFAGGRLRLRIVNRKKFILSWEDPERCEISVSNRSIELHVGKIPAQF